MKTYIVSQTKDAIEGFAMTLVIGVVFAYLATITLADSKIQYIFALLLVFKFFFYRLSDYLFVRTIIEINDELFLKILFFRIKIDKTRCYVVIKDFALISLAGNAKEYMLTLVRNDRIIFFRLFKNTIKLYTDDGKIDLNGTAMKISNIFSIPYRGIDTGTEGYSDNVEILRKNKGVIP